ncbi:hypothetical protein PR048_024744 [Dryococelus australis]|uniref:Uncharacterized protein n=1 Tax=Dryococelus australis TaxID=614101 RepID=A0ABQ9GPI9_9NEOP|nr:hypothetical protein PR048_024744 [Dryococelus australis]
MRVNYVCMEQPRNEGAVGKAGSWRKPAERRHRPTRFLYAKKREWPDWGLNPVRLGGSRASRPGLYRRAVKATSHCKRFAFSDGPPPPPPLTTFHSRSFVRSFGNASRRLALLCDGSQSAHCALSQRQDRSPTTKANRIRFPAGSLPDFRTWEWYRTMPLVGGFSRGSPEESPSDPRGHRDSRLSLEVKGLRTTCTLSADCVCASAYTIYRPSPEEAPWDMCVTERGNEEIRSNSRYRLDGGRGPVTKSRCARSPRLGVAFRVLALLLSGGKSGSGGVSQPPRTSQEMMDPTLLVAWIRQAYWWTQAYPQLPCHVSRWCTATLVECLYSLSQDETILPAGGPRGSTRAFAAGVCTLLFKLRPTWTHGTGRTVQVASDVLKRIMSEADDAGSLKLIQLGQCFAECTFEAGCVFTELGPASRIAHTPSKLLFAVLQL